MLVYIGNEKGGVGKTTITLMLSLYFKMVKEIEDTMVIDTDLTQQSILKTMIRRKENGLDFVKTITKQEEIEKVLNDNDSKLVFIDGKANVDNLDYLVKSDFVIIPCGCNFFEIDMTKDFIELIETKKIKYSVLINNVYSEEDYLETKKHFKNVFKNYLKHSDRYRKIDFKSGKCDLDNYMLSVYKWYTKKEIGLISKELLGFLNN